ncbi:MAG: hypothetical protein PWP51_2165 [Clostridiales bacterium]|jgi:hypothetical protein|nr:hypothetical protein [Clostridiales bacterium]MDN5299612.1 hypothetical protein [Clostridiales bacterium]
MGKTLCKLVDDDYLDEHFKGYSELVKSPNYICKKCGRASNDEKKLCKPKKIKE